MALVLLCLVSMAIALTLRQRFGLLYEDDDSKVRVDRKTDVDVILSSSLLLHIQSITF